MLHSKLITPPCSDTKAQQLQKARKARIQLRFYIESRIGRVSNEECLQVIDRGDTGKLANIITLRYMFTSNAS